MSANQIASGTEEAAVNEFGYRQELKRVLCLFAVFSVAFSIISITTGIFLNFGFAITHLGPASIWLCPRFVEMEYGVPAEAGRGRPSRRRRHPTDDRLAPTCGCPFRSRSDSPPRTTSLSPQRPVGTRPILRCTCTRGSRTRSTSVRSRPSSETWTVARTGERCTTRTRTPSVLATRASTSFSPFGTLSIRAADLPTRTSTAFSGVRPRLVRRQRARSRSRNMRAVSPGGASSRSGG